MSKVGLMTASEREDSLLSGHFGKTPWVMIRSDDSSVPTVELNEPLRGHAVIEILQRHGCTDAVFTQIGAGALRHLQEAGIRGWIAPPDTPVAEVLQRFRSGDLPPATAKGGHEHLIAIG